MSKKLRLIFTILFITVFTGSYAVSISNAQSDNTQGYYKEIVIGPLLQTETGSKLKIGDKLIDVSPSLEIKICGDGPFDISYFSRIVGKNCSVFISTASESPIVESISLLCE